jgi:hypothetical protein
MQDPPALKEMIAKRNAIEQLVLNLLAESEQKPWSLEEVFRPLERTATHLEIQDALAHLRSVGLLNQAGEIYFASQATAHATKLGMMGL